MARRHHGGTGLGLAICQRLVTLMGGSMGLQSALGEGTTISFELPFEPAPAAVGQAAASPPGSVQLPALELLVVEDDEINRIVCQRYLEALGHRVQVAGDGAAALEWLRRPQQRCDGVLMDISLPGASGFEVARAIHELDGGRWHQLPIIGMSAHVNAETFERQAAAGMAGFLGKPFQRAELSRALASAVVPAGLPPPAATELADAPTDEPADPLLDLAYLAEELEGLGRPMLLQLLDMFRQQADVASTGLQEAMEQGDLAALGRLAHKLRSAAGNLGLLRLLADCRALELAAKQGGQGKTGQADQAVLAPLLDRLLADCRLSAGALEQWLASPAQPGLGGGSGGEGAPG